MNELEVLLEKMHGQSCWSMMGPGAGSWFSLYFGGRRKRKKPVRNDTLRPEQREFQGEFMLYVWMSGWRLLHQGRCVCDCNSSNAINGPMVTGLRKLENTSLRDHSFGRKASELTLNFSNDLRLEFGDWEGVPPGETAFALSDDEVRVSVTMNGQIVSLQRPADTSADES